MKEKVSAGERVREIRRKTRKTYSAEEKVRIVLGEESEAALCRREGIHEIVDILASKITAGQTEVENPLESTSWGRCAAMHSGRGCSPPWP